MSKRIRTMPAGPHFPTKERFIRSMDRMSVPYNLIPIVDSKGDGFKLELPDMAWFDIIRICNGTILVRTVTTTSGWKPFPVGKSTSARAKTERLVRYLMGIYKS